MDYAALAAQFGGTPVQQQPQPQGGAAWVNSLPPRDQNEMKIKLYEEGRKRVNELRDMVYKGEQNLNMLNRFGDLNRENATGGLIDYFNAGQGYLQGDAEREMESISNQLAPNQRIAGSGASSDTDVKMFLSSLPSVKNKGQVNKGIRQNYEMQYNYALEKTNFLDNWLQEKGSLVGADAAWVKYRASVLDPKTNKPKPGMNYEVFKKADEIISGGR